MKSREGVGRHRLDHEYCTPLYKKGIKKTENKSMETTYARLKTAFLTGYWSERQRQSAENEKNNFAEILQKIIWE